MREFLRWWWRTIGWNGVALYALYFSFWSFVGLAFIDSITLALMAGVAAVIIWFVMMDLWVYKQVKR